MQNDVVAVCADCCLPGLISARQSSKSAHLHIVACFPVLKPGQLGNIVAQVEQRRFMLGASSLGAGVNAPTPRNSCDIEPKFSHRRLSMTLPTYR